MATLLPYYHGVLVIFMGQPELALTISITPNSDCMQAATMYVHAHMYMQEIGGQGRSP